MAKRLVLVPCLVVLMGAFALAGNTVSGTESGAGQPGPQATEDLPVLLCKAENLLHSRDTEACTVDFKKWFQVRAEYELSHAIYKKTEGFAQTAFDAHQDGLDGVSEENADIGSAALKHWEGVMQDYHSESKSYYDRAKAMENNLMRYVVPRYAHLQEDQPQRYRKHAQELLDHKKEMREIFQREIGEAKHLAKVVGRKSLRYVGYPSERTWKDIYSVNFPEDLRFNRYDMVGSFQSLHGAGAH